MTNQTFHDNQTLSMAYVKQEGSARAAYYVDVIVCFDDGDSAPVAMLVDTGAMISSVPADLFINRSVRLGEPLKLQYGNGKVQKVSTYRVGITLLDNGVHWSTIRPPRGVTARKNCDQGLLGLDILCEYDVLLMAGGGLIAKIGGAE